MAPVIPLVIGLLCGPAFAGVEDDLESAERSATDLVETAGALDQRIAPGRAFLSQVDAQNRYDDALQSLVLQDYRQAAETLFALVTTGALLDPETQRDAEWYLSEALLGMGNIVTAEARLRAVAEASEHPYRELAVRRLLELYAGSGQERAFTDLYEREIVRGRVRSNDVVTYTIAKSFYLRKDYERAAQYFAEVVPGARYYSRSQYFLGVLRLLASDLDGALPFFEAAAASPADTDDLVKTQDLALLAIGRIHYEKFEFDEASESYRKVSPRSPYLADVLREQVWSSIRRERYDEALSDIDLFLLAFPEHRYSGQLRVVRGHLFMGCAQEPTRCPDPEVAGGGDDAYERALNAYDAIVADYSPIRDRFGRLARSQDEPRAYFAEVFATDEEAGGELPPFVVAMMRGDEELGGALELYERVQEQQADLVESELMVAELQAMLDGPMAVGGFEASRYQAIVNQARAIREQVELLDLEQAWLAGQDVQGLDRFDQEVSNIQLMSDAVEDRLRRRRASVERASGSETERLSDEIAAVDREIDLARDEVSLIRRQLDAPNKLSDEDRDAVEQEVEGIMEVLLDSRTRLAELRVELSQIRAPIERLEESPVATGVDAELTGAIERLRGDYQSMRTGSDAEIAARFDAVHAQLEDAQATYARVLDRIETLAESEIATIRERFAAEVVEVAAQRAELDVTSREVETVAVDLTRQGFARMESFFAESVLKAELGIIDVYWARKLEIADQRQRIQDERNTLVSELERRFAIIRQKLEQ